MPSVSSALLPSAVAPNDNGNMNGGNSNGSSNGGNDRAVALALELALLQQQGGGSNGSSNGHGPHHGGHHHHSVSDLHNGHGGSNAAHAAHAAHLHHPDVNPLLAPFPMGGSSSSGGGSLEDLKSFGLLGGGGSGRRSQNMTECVPVPTSEHVAEIVGRQGCKIKALRAKTNTYIKTPVRGEEPVFVVTGRKEDVALAKREILSAADHFSQIRASRTKNSINSTLAFGQAVANQPGQTTVQVRVPYRVVGLVVGPKGATIKRIQQQTHTYIVTPSRDKEPVFEVTGQPENVDAARKEIEAHIALRTGNEDGNGSNGSNIGSSLYGMGGSGDFDRGNNGFGGSNGFSSSSGHLDGLGSGGNKFNGLHGGNAAQMHHHNHHNNGMGGSSNGHHNHHHMDSAFSSLNSSSSGSNGKPITLQGLIDSGNFGDLNGGVSNNGGGGFHRSNSTPWSNGTGGRDSGLGNSPPFEANGHHPLEASLSADTHHMGGGAQHAHHQQQMFRQQQQAHMQQQQQQQHPDNGTGIWGELNKMLGSLDLNGASSSSSSGFGAASSTATRSSLDLGTLGRPSAGASLSAALAGAADATSAFLGMSSGSSGHNSPPPAQLPSFAARASISGSSGADDAAALDDAESNQLVHDLVNSVVTSPTVAANSSSQ